MDSSLKDYDSDVAIAVRIFGGIERAAKFLKVEPETVENYARTGCMPDDLAKKLGKVANVHWKLLRSPN